MFVYKIYEPIFAPLLRKHNKDDSVAQLVEHIPFKDGVLGSNPS